MMIFYYHTCRICGKKINPERLEIFPRTKICKECSELKGSDLEFNDTVIAMDPDTFNDLLKSARS